MNEIHVEIRKKFNMAEEILIVTVLGFGVLGIVAILKGGLIWLVM